MHPPCKKRVDYLLKTIRVERKKSVSLHDELKKNKYCEVFKRCNHITHWSLSNATIRY